MKNILLTILIVPTIWFCTTNKNISKNEIKKDSILVVKEIKIDTIKLFEYKEIEKPTSNEINLKCDSTSFNQNYKSGKVEYRIIKEKGLVRVVIKTDTITNIIKDSYYSKLYKKDSLQKTKIETKKEKLIIKEPSFWQNILTNIWRVFFWIFFILFVLGFSLSDLIISIVKLNK